MLIGARQDCIAGATDLSGKMQILKAMGYDFLELSLKKEDVQRLSEAQTSEYRSAIDQTGLRILSTSMGHFGGFAGKSAEERSEIGQDVRHMVALTRAIGGDALLLATYETGGSVDQWAGRYRAELRAVADEAAEAGVTLALEHVGWFKPHQLADLVAQIDHPALRIYFDMGNCLYVGEDPLEEVRACGPYVAQLHVKGGPTTPLAAMPLRQVRESLAAFGFSGRACLEISAQPGDRHLAEARALLKMAGYLG